MRIRTKPSTTVDEELYQDEDYKKACQCASVSSCSVTKESKGSGTKTGGDSRVWMGRAFGGQPVPINDVLGEEQNDVVLQARSSKSSSGN